MNFEGRGSKRVDSENLLAYRLFDKDKNVISDGMVKTLDISKTGIAISSQKPMEPGYKIELTIGLGEEVVKAHGMVKNQKSLPNKQYQIGIEFDFLTEEDLNKIGMLYPSILK